MTYRRRRLWKITKARRSGLLRIFRRGPKLHEAVWKNQFVVRSKDRALKGTAWRQKRSNCVLACLYPPTLYLYPTLKYVRVMISFTRLYPAAPSCAVVAPSLVL
jgi:hypothetical protein